MKISPVRISSALRLASALAFAAPFAAHAAPPLRFDFGTGPIAPGFTQVTADTLYTRATGYGLIQTAAASVTSSVAANAADSDDPLRNDALVSDKPFSFIIDLPEGNYDVILQLGDPRAESDTTVKSETRRLQIESLKLAAGTFQTRTFTVNIRTPSLAGGGRVSLKSREIGSFHWDDKLILEFNGPHPAVAGLEIRRNDAALTVFLAGDSTVTDQPGEPWAAWGQMLPRFFPAGVAVANQAESGLSLASFRGAGRLRKINEQLKPGDYVFIQFGHNDMKETGEGVGAYTTYASELRGYIDSIRELGGEPILVTPMYRRRFQGTTITDSLGDYPPAVRLIAKEKAVPLIDLHEMSGRILTALGPEQSKRAYVHFPAGAYPGATKDVKDDTHFSPYGAYLLASCVVEGIRANVPSLAERLAPGLPTFNPDQPTAAADFNLAASPAPGEVRIPDGDGR